MLLPLETKVLLNEQQKSISERLGSPGVSNKERVEDRVNIKGAKRKISTEDKNRLYKTLKYNNTCSK